MRGCYVALGLVLLLAVSFCLTELAEVDLHWHLLAGQEILRTGRVPRVDSFSYTSSGNAWIDLHWLFQAVVAFVYDRAGWTGLDVLKIALIAAAFALTMAAALRRGASAAIVAPIAFVAVLASQERFTLRPEAASFFLLGLVLLCLERRHARPGVLALIPLLAALWANLHALYAIGLTALAMVAAGDVIEARWPRSEAGSAPTPRRTGLLLIAGAAATLATALTPYGILGWSLPRRLLFERLAADNIYARNIAEFQAPFGGYGVTTSIAAFAVLVSVVALAALVAGRRTHPADLLLLGSFLLVGLLARRNIPLFALVAIAAGSPVVEAAARRIGDLPALRRAGPRRLARLLPAVAAIAVGAATVVVLGQVASNRFYERDGTQRYFGRGWSPGFYPEGAAEFVLDRRLPGEAIHDLSTGGFLAWRWHPERRVFIDGRLELHDEALFATYLRMQSDPEVFEETARRLDARVVVASYRPEGAGLLRHLASGRGWKPVFVDLAAAVFVREEAAASFSLRAVDLADPDLGRRILREIDEAYAASARRDPLSGFIRRVLPRREVPVAEVNAAIFFGIVGREGNAELLFRRALAKAPRNPVLHYDLGLVLEGSGRAAEARAAYEEALRVDPGFAPARVARALRLLRDGEPDRALDEWGIAERSGPLGPVALQARGALLASRGRLDEAIEDYRRALQAEPRRARLHGDLALLYHRRGFRDRALEEIRRAAALDAHGCFSRVALARIEAADGDAPRAERLLREAIARDASCGEAFLGLAGLLASSGREDEALRAAAQAIEAGLDPQVVAAEASLRPLAARPAFRDLLRGARTPPLK